MKTFFYLIILLNNYLIIYLIIISNKCGWHFIEQWFSNLLNIVLPKIKKIIKLTKKKNNGIMEI